MPAEPTLVSIVIPNYNYGAFVGQAIRSALALDWPALEVIVVDDGSTDHSRSVIEEFGEQITAVYQENAGQRAAYNTGFARSRGEIVLFLDSDDLVDPSLLRELMTVWRTGLSKVQFQMKVVDAEGKPTGALLPQFQVVPTPEEVRRWVLTSASYPTPPGSGNAYARRFLEQIFPLEGTDKAADSYCLAAAPFLGDVITIAKPLVSYRVHGGNQGAVSHLDRPRFTKELERALDRFQYSLKVAHAAGIEASDTVLARSLSVLPYRLASLTLLPERHPIAHDTQRMVLKDMLAACLVPQGVSVSSRAVLVAWAVAVIAAPDQLGERFVLWRFAPTERPEALTRLLRLFKVVKRYQPPSAQAVIPAS